MLDTLRSPALFSREAGRVLHSPYWTAFPNSTDTQELLKFSRERDGELAQLKAALDKANSYRDLRPAAKAIYDKAKAALGKPEPEKAESPQVS